MTSEGQIADAEASGQYDSVFGDVARRTFGLDVGDRASASSWLLSRIPDGADVFLSMKLRRNALNAVFVFFGLPSCGEAATERDDGQVTEIGIVAVRFPVEQRRELDVKTSDCELALLAKGEGAGTWSCCGVGVRAETTFLCNSLGLRHGTVPAVEDANEKVMSDGNTSADTTVHSSIGELLPDELRELSLPPGIWSRLSDSVSQEAIGASLVFGSTGATNAEVLGVAELTVKSLSTTIIGSGRSYFRKFPPLPKASFSLAARAPPSARPTSLQTRPPTPNSLFSAFDPTALSTCGLATPVDSFGATWLNSRQPGKHGGLDRLLSLSASLPIDCPLTGH